MARLGYTVFAIGLAVLSVTGDAVFSGNHEAQAEAQAYVDWAVHWTNRGPHVVYDPAPRGHASGLMGLTGGIAGGHMSLSSPAKVSFLRPTSLLEDDTMGSHARDAISRRLWSVEKSVASV